MGWNLDAIHTDTNQRVELMTKALILLVQKSTNGLVIGKPH